MHDGTLFRIWACRWLLDKTVQCEPESLVLVNDVALKTPEPRLPLTPNSLAALCWHQAFEWLGYWYHGVGGDQDRARGCFLRALKLDPERKGAGEALTSLYLESGQV